MPFIIMNTRRGFSLVELSIVLVILGLLVGGVLSGQSLIRAAQLRSVTMEYQKLAAASNAFRDKYFALPGDMPNAINFWGAADPNPLVCKNNATTDTKTCNGNGDGKILANSQSWEEPSLYKHLSNAGLIEGTYSGRGSVSSDFYTSKFSSDVQWVPAYNDPISANSSSWYFGNAYGNYVLLSSWTNGYSINAVDAWNVDKKMDDGLPGTGKILSNKGNGANPCTSNQSMTSDANATYNVSQQGINCYLFFLNFP